MFRQVIVGIDEHQGGRDAIALAKLLVARDGELTLAYLDRGSEIVVTAAAVTG